jgi:hypothetical protein
MTDREMFTTTAHNRDRHPLLTHRYVFCTHFTLFLPHARSLPASIKSFGNVSSLLAMMNIEAFAPPSYRQCNTCRRLIAVLSPDLEPPPHSCADADVHRADRGRCLEYFDADMVRASFFVQPSFRRLDVDWGPEGNRRTQARL